MSGGLGSKTRKIEYTNTESKTTYGAKLFGSGAGIDFYPVGATARDVWMRGVHEVTPKRATSDLDFAVMLKDSEQFGEL